MAYKPLRMDKVKRILEYHSDGVSIKKISRLTGVSRNTIKKYIRRHYQAKSNDENVNTPSTNVSVSYDAKENREAILESQFPDIIKELGRVGVTRHTLWEEYIVSHPDGYSYSRFCRKLKGYRARQDVTLRIEHKAGYRMSIDYAGKKMPWVDRKTGEVKYAEVLICSMPYSAHTFAVAVNSQKQEDFITGINAALIYMGGLPQVIQSDNLKSYVKKADRYEPTFTELCTQFSSYYGVELEATRVGKPKDKASVERHVSWVYQRVYAPLRNEVFHSINAINMAFVKHIDMMNDKPLVGKDYTRRQRFEADEKPHLKKLPPQMFEMIKSTRAKVQRNYHIILGEDKHQYSVPYQYVGKQTEVVYTSKKVEIYCNTQRIAIHHRDRRPYSYTTTPIHMPEKHKKYLEQKGWDSDYFKSQASKIGPMTLWAITYILESKGLVEQTYNSCLGVLRMQKTYGADRLETACSKANTTYRVSYGILKTILENNMDKAPDPPKQMTLFTTPKHDNIRGAKNYY